MDDKLTNQLSVQVCNLLDQSIIKIQHCLSQIDETQLWWRPEPSMNSIGNLLLHAAGNLRQWSIVPLSGTDDQRDREQEFSDEIRMSKSQVVQLVQQTIDESKQLIRSISSTMYLQEVTIQGFEVTLLKAILHTSCHFQGHTHQIIQLTRLQQKSNYKFHWSPNTTAGDLPM